MGTTIPARDLRNHYRKVIERVRGGERLTVVTDGEAVMDLVPHVPEDAPPMFRSTDRHPAWPAMAPDVAADWLTDIRALDDVVDQDLADPWERR